MSGTPEALNIHRISTQPLDEDLHYLVRTYSGIIGNYSHGPMSVDLKILKDDYKKEVKELRRLGWERAYFIGHITTYSQADTENFAYGWTPQEVIVDDERLKEVCDTVDVAAEKASLGVTSGLVLSQSRLDIRPRSRFADVTRLVVPQSDDVYAAVTSFRDRTAMISNAYDEIPEILASGSDDALPLFQSRETQSGIIDPSLVHEEEWRLMEALHEGLRDDFANSFRPQ